jgi:hypothetical protein
MRPSDYPDLPPPKPKRRRSKKAGIERRKHSVSVRLHLGSFGTEQEALRVLENTKKLLRDSGFPLPKEK